MAVDLKAELTRPPALILSALAALGWVLFALSSWSAASVQKSQRLQIADLTSRSEQLSTDLARQVQASTSLTELQAKVAATRDELTRVTQTRTDVQAELAAAQRNLQGVRRDLTDADRSLQNQAQRLVDIQTNTEAATATLGDQQQVTRPARRGRKWSRRGRRASR